LCFAAADGNLNDGLLDTHAVFSVEVECLRKQGDTFLLGWIEVLSTSRQKKWLALKFLLLLFAVNTPRQL